MRDKNRLKEVTLRAYASTWGPLFVGAKEEEFLFSFFFGGSSTALDVLRWSISIHMQQGSASETTFGLVLNVWS